MCRTELGTFHMFPVFQFTVLLRCVSLVEWCYCTTGNRIQMPLNSLVVFLFFILSPNKLFHGDTLQITSSDIKIPAYSMLEYRKAFFQKLGAPVHFIENENSLPIFCTYYCYFIPLIFPINFIELSICHAGKTIYSKF